MSFKCVPIYGLMFRILTRFHSLYFGASCIHRNSIVWRRVNLARFPYWPEKWTRRISRYSYLMKTLISSEYDLTISGHVTVLRQWLLEKNTDYIIMTFILFDECWNLYFVEEYYIFFQNHNICCTFVNVYQIFSIYMILLRRFPFIVFVINVVLTICCAWWVCFGYREQQTIVNFAFIDDRVWQSGPKF